MKNHQRLMHGAGLSILMVAACFVGGQAIADPLTGGNPPYEDVAPPCAVSCYFPPERCPWYIQTDAIGLRRDPYRRITFATLGTRGDVALSTSELDRQFQAGGELLVGHTFGNSPWSIEGSYFGLNQWESSAELRNFSRNSFDTEGNLFSPFTNFGNPPVQGFDFNNLVTIHDMSRLQNGELNVKYLLPMPNVGFRASFLTGVRYMNIEEEFLYHSESAVPVAAGGSVVNFSTHTTNGLIGPQIGGFFEIYSLPGSWITFEMKGAICGNTANEVTTNAATGDFIQDDRIVTAFVGDLQLMFNWKITRHIVTRFGYQAVWVDGLALASRNLGPAGTALAFGPPGIIPPIEGHGETVYHGPHLGVEIRW